MTSGTDDAPARRDPTERRVRIYYTRPPNPPDVYEQALVHEDSSVSITLTVDLDLPSTKVIDGRVAMEPGSSILWFTYPDRWHDIGKCYRRDGTYSGIYANVLTPVRFAPDDVWHTTDLCLDVWLPPGEAPVLLDEDALQAAESIGAISAAHGERARQEAEALMEGARSGAWPPTDVADWSLGRAIRRLSSAS